MTIDTHTTTPSGGSGSSRWDGSEQIDLAKRAEEPKTFLPDLSKEPPAQRKRAINAATDEELFVRFGSIIAGVALAWLICYRLLPWQGLVPLFIFSALFTASIAAMATAMRAPGPEVTDRVMTVVMHVGALLVGMALVSTVLYTFWNGKDALFNWNQYTHDMAGVGPRNPLSQGGFLHAVVGSIIEVGIAIAITVPLGIGTAIFMTEVGGPLARIVRTIVEAMTALPSVVAGLFIYTALIVPPISLPRSGLAASLALSVMMLPIIARASDVVLRVVPGSLREASLALGATQWRTVWHVVLPTARPGLATALILGVARGVGETSPVLLTSGAATFMVANPFEIMNSLPLFIFQSVRSGEPGLIARAYGAASVLLFLVLVLFVVARRMARQKTAKPPKRAKPVRTASPAPVPAGNSGDLAAVSTLPTPSTTAPVSQENP